MNPKNTPTKPGVKTTEFWLTLAFMALANLGPLASEIPGQWGVIANALVLAAYTLSRGKAKSLGVAIPLLLLAFMAFSLSSCGTGGPAPTTEQLDAGYQLVRLLIEPAK